MAASDATNHQELPIQLSMYEAKVAKTLLKVKSKTIYQKVNTSAIQLVMLTA